MALLWRRLDDDLARPWQCRLNGPAMAFGLAMLQHVSERSAAIAWHTMGMPWQCLAMAWHWPDIYIYMCVCVISSGLPWTASCLGESYLGPMAGLIGIVGMAWQWLANGLALAWQWLGNGSRFGNALAVMSSQCLGSELTITSKCFSTCLEVARQ